MTRGKKDTGAKSRDPKGRWGHWSILRKEGMEKLILSGSGWDGVSKPNFVFLVDWALSEIRNKGLDAYRH